MGKSQLIHNNEFHLINKAEIRKATGKLVESLNLAAGSTDGFDIYKVVDAYFTDLDKRHEMNALLGIGESCQYYGEQEQVEEAIKEIDGWTSPFVLFEKAIIIYQPIFLSGQRALQCHPVSSFQPDRLPLQILLLSFHRVLQMISFRQFLS